MLEEELKKKILQMSTLFSERIGDDYLELKQIQTDWFAFLGGITVEYGDGLKKSMLNNGSQKS